MKKEWKKPVITIVTKSTAEENVLVSCKDPADYSPGEGPGSASLCYWEANPTPPDVVGYCQAAYVS